MNKKNIITVLSFLLFSQIAFAQTAHNLKSNSICRFVKGKKNSEGMVACNACAEQRKKDVAAMEIEFKKRIAEGKKQEAENLKKIQQDYVKRSAELKQKIEAQSKNVVSFALPKTEQKEIVATKTTKTELKTEYIYTYSGPITRYLQIDNYGNGYSYALNSKGDTILRRNELYYEFYGLGLSNNEYKKRFPKNVVVTKLNIKAKCKKYPEKDCLPVWDILNKSGQRHFNDNRIVGIIHISDNYFLVLFAPSDGNNPDYNDNSYEKAAIYNISNKSFFWLEDKVVFRDGSYLKVLNEVSHSPFRNNEQKAIESWDNIMMANNINDYVVLRTGWHYPDKYAVYYISPTGKIEKKTFINNDRIISEVNN